MLRLLAKTPDGQGFDLSSVAQGLQYSNVRPGGDEQCSFQLLTSWLDSNPQVKRGSIVRVLDGLDVLWQGRLEELDRSSGETETMDVTCYGLGARLKDGLFRQIFIDRDLNKWTGPSRTRKLSLLPSFHLDDSEVTSDATNGLPALVVNHVGVWSITTLSELYYDCGPDLTAGALYYDFTSSLSGAAVTRAIDSILDDTAAGAVTLASLGTLASGSGYVTPGTRCILIQDFSTAGGTEDVNQPTAWRQLAVYGSHGLTRQGPDPGGFTSGQLVGYIAGLVPGISVRNVSAGSFIITQFVIDTPTHHEDAIAEAAAFDVGTFGTWGPSSVLDRSDQGYFDFTILNENIQGGDWLLSRGDCDDIALHDELGSLYNKLRVSWRDTSGEEFVEIRTATIPVLEEAGLGLAAAPREQELDAGLGTQAIAQQFGDTYFGIQGTDPPSRGSIQLSAPVRHVSRGFLPPHYMRADGSTVKIREVLPRSEALSLGRADRRTIFPIQRVSVDASNSAVPKVSVDLDQTPDRLSVIQARMSEAAPALGGGSLLGGTAPPAASQTQAPSAKKRKGKNKRRKRGGLRGGLV